MVNLYSVSVMSPLQMGFFMDHSNDEKLEALRKVQLELVVRAAKLISRSARVWPRDSSALRWIDV